MQKCQQILAQVRANRYVSQKRERRAYPLTRLTGRGKEMVPVRPPLCDHVWTGTQIRSSLNSVSDQLIPAQAIFCADRRPFVAWARGARGGR
jgi:hypothetical protein